MDFSIDDAFLDAASTLNYSFTFTENSVNIDFGGTLISAGDFIQINLTPVSVPEPASIAFMGLGLLGLAVSRKRKC